MQDIMQRLGLSSDNSPVMDQNQAAIALAMAMQKARADLADREGVQLEAQAFGTSKLDGLRRRLVPLYAALPRDVEFLELGLVNQHKPRLFLDMLAFVEMTKDQMGFRLVQETRSGRTTVAETQNENGMVEAVTAYIARRLIDRERALAAEAPSVASANLQPSLVQPDPLVIPKIAIPKSEAGLVTETAKTVDAPLTAEQAFRQWSRGSSTAETVTQAVDSSGVATPVVAVSSPAVEPEVIEPALPKTSAIDRRVTRAQAAESAAEPEAMAPSPSDGFPRRVAPAAAATSKVAAPMPVVQIKRSSGWWLWPILALLIGAAMGATALYFYAASLAR